MAKAGIPSDVLGLLASAEQRAGLPAGTLSSVMQQEVGGQTDRFLADPSTYHYAANDQGQRIAAHTGKVSTAFGPFGILESTAADPGFGVAPLKDKSLPEQVRFYSDYLAARSRSGGGLPAGLAGVGEGKKYANQVLARVGKQGPDGTQEQVAASPLPPTPSSAGASAPALEYQSPTPPVVTAAPEQVAAATPAVNAWQQFQATVAAKPQVQPQDLQSYGQAPVQIPTMQAPSFPMAAPGSNLRPDFRSFLAMKRWA